MEWTPEDIERLKRLTEEKTLPHIATELGRDKEQVRWMIRKLGLRTKVPWARSQVEADQIVRYSDKYGCQAAADLYKMTLDAVKALRRRVAKGKKKDIERLDPEQMQRLRVSAIKYACHKGHSQEAEDFASSVMIQALHHEKINLKWMFISYLRDRFGNLRGKKGAAKNQARWYKQIEENPDVGEPNAGVQVGETPVDSMAVIRALDGVVLTPDERTCFVLSLHFGLRGIEIALVLDLTPQRVAMILEKATQKVAKRQKAS